MNEPPKKCEPVHSPHVTLKEYFEEKLAALDKLRKQEAETLIIQAKEYERRLEGLNHEAKRIDEAANKSVSREVFDTFLRGDSAWKAQSERDRASHLVRADFESQHSLLKELIAATTVRISVLETALNTAAQTKQRGLSTAGAIMLGVFAGMGAIAGIVTMVINLLRH